MVAATRTVVHPDEIEPQRVGNAELRTTFDARNGCERLQQRVIRFAGGRSEPRSLEGEQEILYVVAGRGMLELDGKRYELEPDTGAFITAGETYFIDVAEPLEVVSVVAPASGEPGATRKVTVHYADQPEFEASPERMF